MCPKCKSEKTMLSKDKRGIFELRCADCGAYIRKISSAEAQQIMADEKDVAIFEEAIIPPKVETPKEEEAMARDNKMVCKFCTEPVFIRRGRLGTVYTPIESFFCPVCGRKKRPEDTKY